MADNNEMRLIIEGPNAPAEFLLPMGTTSIGRQPDSDLQLPDTIVSRSHAIVVRSEEGCVLIDLESANGTYLNDKKLAPELPNPLEAGDSTRIGPYQLRLESIAEPEPVQAAEEPEEILEAVDAAEPEPPKMDAAGGGEDEPPRLPVEEAQPEFDELIPPGLSLRSRRLINFLPGIYHTDFMRRFLGIFESIQIPIEWSIDNFDLFLNPGSAPEDFLPWLANWFQLAWGADWSTEQRRSYLQEAQQIYARRGTRWALSRVLEIYTGSVPEIIDTGKDLEPFTFRVRLTRQIRPEQRGQVEALIVAHKPVHTAYVLELAK